MRQIIFFNLGLPLLWLLLLLLFILAPDFFEPAYKVIIEKNRAYNRIIAECSICMEGITEVKRNKLRYGHPFHDKCITRWIREQNRCPICRAVAELQNSRAGFFC